jgi:rubrerythrin
VRSLEGPGASFILPWLRFSRMGIRDYFAGADRLHHECRECGRNVESDRECCPVCGGRIATYDL